METVSEAEREIRFTRLAHEVGEPLRRYVVRRAPAAAVDDVLAETFLVLWRRLDDVPRDDALPWAYAVARRCVANAHRSARRQLSLIERIGRLDPPRPAPEVDEHPELLAALDALPAADREVVMLWAWEELAPAGDRDRHRADRQRGEHPAAPGEEATGGGARTKDRRRCRTGTG